MQLTKYVVFFVLGATLLSSSEVIGRLYQRQVSVINYFMDPNTMKCNINCETIWTKKL